MISVALCTYNGEKFIEEQLLSILNQTLPVDEIVVCDDGSTDKTKEILETYQKNDNRIKIHINNSNLGIIKNFEKAISLAKGDIIFLSDQDDVWLRTKVELMNEIFITKPQSYVLFSNAELIDENNATFTSKTLFDIVNFSDKTKKYFSDGLDFELLNIENRITGATMAFRKSYISEILPFKNFEKILHDEFIAISAINDNCLYMIDKCLISYRIHRNQIMGLGSWINVPPDSNIFKFKLVKSDYTKFLNFKGHLKQKIEFLEKREKIIKTVTGVLILLFSIKNYNIIYGKYANGFIQADFIEYIKLNSRRIKRIFHA